MYFRGQGRVYIGTRDALGNPQALRFVGNCPELKLGLSTEYIEHKESYTGQSVSDVKIAKTNTTSLNFTLEEFTKENLALALAGTANTIASSTAIVDEKLGGTPDITSLAVGQVFVAAKRNGSSITVKDSSGSPKTLTLNTNYSIEPHSMTITLLDVTTGGSFTGPLKVSYTPGGASEIAMFNQSQQDLFLRFVGMNMADNGKIVTVDLYKVQLTPAKEIGFITDELGALAMEGAALLDLLKASNATLGQFGAIYQQS